MAVGELHLKLVQPPFPQPVSPPNAASRAYRRSRSLQPRRPGNPTATHSPAATAPMTALMSVKRPARPRQTGLLDAPGDADAALLGVGLSLRLEFLQHLLQRFPPPGGIDRARGRAIRRGVSLNLVEATSPGLVPLDPAEQQGIRQSGRAQCGQHNDAEQEHAIGHDHRLIRLPLPGRLRWRDQARRQGEPLHCNSEHAPRILADRCRSNDAAP